MIVWVDASAGASGDMLLGALVGAGVPVEVLQAAVAAVAPEPTELSTETVQRNGLAAIRCRVVAPNSGEHRTWREVRALIEAAALDPAVRDTALHAFERLAVAEAAVHGTAPEDVTFHEVGALDAIADVVGVCAGFAHLAPTEVVVGPVAVGSGAARAAHGTLPVPAPAVAELLRGVPSYAGPDGAPAMELCTPTGAALLTTLATGWSRQPLMATDLIGVGAGHRNPHGHPNVLRLLVGDEVAPPAGTVETQILLETNVDDLDPRVWPEVIAALLEAGAVDAWLTPILMKKGRPAHTLSVLVPDDLADVVRAAVFTETSTIGLRETRIAKHALPREVVKVEVDGVGVEVKLARLGRRVVNAQPEYDDVARAAATLGRPVNDVLADATAAARALLDGKPS